MLPPFWLRSTIFNLCFYAVTGIACILMLPTLILPRSAYLFVVYGFVGTTAFLEKYILGLTYEVRGIENLPKSGSYIVAAKHQSAYETFKLHILFNDPAVVLKKELLKIPLWGRYLAKSDVIAIDRSTPKMAIESIQAGAKRMAAQGRPIVIFPQGTRVAPHITAKDRPYKIGVVRIQEATGLPIIPMALNTGIFYPKSKWCKKSGRVVFEFLPPIPSGGDAATTLKTIEDNVEARSAALTEEGLRSVPKKSILGLILTSGFFIAYTIYWFAAAHLTAQAVEKFLNDLRANREIKVAELASPAISGFPFKLKLDFPAQKIETEKFSLHIGAVHARSWPALGMPIDVTAEHITFKLSEWQSPLDFESLEAMLINKNEALDIKDSILKSRETLAGLTGIVDFKVKPYPDINLVMTIQNHVPFLVELTAKKIIKARAAMIAGAALQAMQKDGVVTTPITRNGNGIYLGILRIFEFPQEETGRPVFLEDGRRSAILTRREKPSP